MSEQTYSQKDLLVLFKGTKDAEGQLKATCEAVNIQPTKKSFSQPDCDAVSMARDWINSGECEDYEQVAKKWQQFLEEGGRLEQSIVLSPSSNSGSSASSDSTEIVAQALDFRTEDAVEKLCDGFDERDKEVAGQVIRAYDALMLQKITEAAASGRMNSKVSMAIEDIGGLGKFPLLERVEAKIAARNQKLLESSTDSSDPPSETT